MTYSLCGINLVDCHSYMCPIIRVLNIIQYYTFLKVVYFLNLSLIITISGRFPVRTGYIKVGFSLLFVSHAYFIDGLSHEI